MRDAKTVRAIHQDRGAKRLPLERVYKHLFNPEIYLEAYGRIYRNFGAMTKGTTPETVDGMDLQKVHRIIDLLRQERFQWTSVRRTEIPKANGKMRPLGIPTWSDKLVQEALRTLLEPYYEQRFSDHSHGFRPMRGCHTALLEIRTKWNGTIWFIEGDIKGCFDNIGHTVMLEILQRDIHDGRLIRLIENLLRAGYMKAHQWFETNSGTPQGGIISPLLANIYLNDLDRFIEDTLIPAYTRGNRRKLDKRYIKVQSALQRARQKDDPLRVVRLKAQLRTLPAVDGFDPDYRRLRYVRYADDFLLGFAGPKKEAEEIRDRIRDFLRDNLKLTLSEEKTLVTHAASDKAKFLGYEITTTRTSTLVRKGKRVNGTIALLMPRKPVTTLLDAYSKRGEVIHRVELINDDDLTIINRYQSILRGLYNYYCMANNVSRRMGTVKWILGISLAKTLARKYRCSATTIYHRYKLHDSTYGFQATRERPGKPPLVAKFGGFPLVRKPEGMGIRSFFRYDAHWFGPGQDRSEAVDRLLAEKCELCGGPGPLQAHHIRKLSDLNRPGRKPKAEWERIMSARKRKSLMVCKECHNRIHTGHHDGPRLRGSLESRVR
jgi:group II intron reverse transcriptase/maturase